MTPKHRAGHYELDGVPTIPADLTDGVIGNYLTAEQEERCTAAIYEGAREIRRRFEASLPVYREPEDWE